MDEYWRRELGRALQRQAALYSRDPTGFYRRWRDNGSPMLPIPNDKPPLCGPPERQKDPPAPKE